ncbi:MAG: hypothetical protein P8Y45_14510 [Exilibacterium sp.]
MINDRTPTASSTAMARCHGMLRLQWCAIVPLLVGEWHDAVACGQIAPQ